MVFCLLDVNLSLTICYQTRRDLFRVLYLYYLPVSSEISTYKHVFGQEGKHISFLHADPQQ